jgi:hypothetical protein
MQASAESAAPAALFVYGHVYLRAHGVRPRLAAMRNGQFTRDGYHSRVN